MAHLSENSSRLELETVPMKSLTQLEHLQVDGSSVMLFWLPWGRNDRDAKQSTARFQRIARYCMGLEASATVCLLTTPSDAASMLPYLEQHMHLRLWIAVKTVPEGLGTQLGRLPTRHASLLILTKYDNALRHVPTRLKYTHCPACRKTTKDYGGKKHMYHSYGTLMSDVWTDIECDPLKDIGSITQRLKDLFGLEPYKKLLLIDLRKSKSLVPRKGETVDRHSLSSSKAVIVTKTVRSRLINEDCIEALTRIRSNSIDFCFADLPYNLKKKYYRCKDALGTDEYSEWCNQWLSELHRVLKPGHTLALLNVPQWAARHFSYLSSIMSFQAWIVWDALGFPARKIMPAHYAILCFSKGAPRTLPAFNGDEDLADLEYLRHRKQLYCVRPACISRRRSQNVVDHSPLFDIWSDVHRLTHNSQRVNHPCQLPPLLMRRLFALFTRKQEVILDCFNGAGTSTLVARQMSRGFVGIEISKRYHALATKRHEMLNRGDDPFGRKDKVPIAKNSRVIRVPKQDYKVTKKVLQLDVQRIAAQLGRIPKREDVRVHSSYPIKYFDNYFSSWGEVCAAARTSGQGQLL